MASACLHIYTLWVLHHQLMAEVPFLKQFSIHQIRSQIILTQYRIYVLTSSLISSHLKILLCSFLSYQIDLFIHNSSHNLFHT